MARIRSLKPEILSDEKSGRLPPELFKTFVGLILQADDYGCMIDNPVILGTPIWWAELEDGTMRPMRQYISDLEDAGLVQRYEADGRKCLGIPNWSKHQRVEHPSPRYLPCPPWEEVCADGSQQPTSTPVPTPPEERPARSHSRGASPSRAKGEPLANVSRAPHEPLGTQAPCNIPGTLESVMPPPDSALPVFVEKGDSVSPGIQPHCISRQGGIQPHWNRSSDDETQVLENTCDSDGETLTSPSRKFHEPLMKPSRAPHESFMPGLGLGLGSQRRGEENTHTPLGDLSGGTHAHPHGPANATGQADAVCVFSLPNLGEAAEQQAEQPQQGAPPPDAAPLAVAPVPGQREPSTKPKRPQGSPSPKPPSAEARSAAAGGSSAAPNGSRATHAASEASTPARGLPGSANAVQVLHTPKKPPVPRAQPSEVDPETPAGGEFWVRKIMSTVAEGSQRTLLPTMPPALLAKAAKAFTGLWELNVRFPEWAGFGEWLVEGGSDGRGGLAGSGVAPSWEWMLREEGRLESLVSQSRSWAYRLDQDRIRMRRLFGKDPDQIEAARKEAEHDAWLKTPEGLASEAARIAGVHAAADRWRAQRAEDKRKRDAEKAQVTEQERLVEKKNWERCQRDASLVMLCDYYWKFLRQVGKAAAEEDAASAGDGLGEKFCAFLREGACAEETAKRNLTALTAADLREARAKNDGFCESQEPEAVDPDDTEAVDSAVASE